MLVAARILVGRESALDRTDLNVLVVRGDGQFVRWLSVPRWIAKTLIAVAVIGGVANVAALAHYASLYRHHATLVHREASGADPYVEPGRDVTGGAAAEQRRAACG